LARRSRGLGDVYKRQLKDAEDAHHTLIEMVKQARKVAK
jgi:hypothetical protein